MNAPTLECRQWYCTAGMSCTIVVAATKEDARLLAAHRFVDAGVRLQCRNPFPVVRAREATPEDVERVRAIFAQMDAIDSVLRKAKQAAS